MAIGQARMHGEIHVGLQEQARLIAIVGNSTLPQTSQD